MSTEKLITGNAPVIMWTDGVPVEEAAKRQLMNIARLPFIHKHVAAMPDVHVGRGATVGSVIATKGAVIPAAVGVDIGCGMMAVRLGLQARRLPDNLKAIRDSIERTVPVGNSKSGGWRRGEAPHRVATRWQSSGLEARLDELQARHPALRNAKDLSHLGTLGGGNHFIELCIDEADDVWVMLHSGSRGVGNRIGQFFIEKAKREIGHRQLGHALPDKELAYLVQGQDSLFDEYMTAVGWAQDYARINREVMMERILHMLKGHLPRFKADKYAVNCHHNYVEQETHFGEEVLITRKGAVRAREGELGIIPGSMGARSFIVRGKGNAESFCSCSHGAGRLMSRSEAKQRFSVAEHKMATKGVECRKDAGVIDETPAAYKDIDAVMAAQTDLVEVVHTLKQVVCVKG